MAETSNSRLARIVQDCLRAGMEIELDGLGTLRPNGDGTVAFRPREERRVFLSYVRENAPQAERLYDAFAAAGFNPWMDIRKLQPGQNWRRCIERSIATSDFFLPCFSRDALLKRSMFHRELRYALDCSSDMPLDDTFVIPVRLEACDLPRRIESQIQYVDLYPDWDAGVASLIRALREETAARVERRTRLLM